MKLSRCLLICFIAAIGVLSTHAQELTPDTMFGVAQYVVRIDVIFTGESGEEEREFGSGIIVSETGIIFTNKHVVDQENITQILISITTTLGVAPEPRYTARPVYVSQDENFDFAILQIDGEPMGEFSTLINPENLALPFIETWASADLRVADTVYLAGYPAAGGEALSFASAPISITARDGNVIVAQADLPVSAGGSGGLVFNEAGEMVGLVYKVQGTGTASTTPILSIQSICEQVTDQCDLLRPNAILENPICLQARVTPYCENTPFTIGMTAQIGSLESEIQLRADPIWRAQWIKPLGRGSFVEIVGGPQVSFDDILRDFELFWWEVEDGEGTRGWVVEDFFGEPVLIPARRDEPLIPSSTCQLTTLYPINIRSGPGEEYEQVASRQFDQVIAADGQFRPGDTIWWRLLPGFWVPEFTVREGDNCFTLPVVAPQ